MSVSTLLSRQFLGPASELLAWMSEEAVTDVLVNGTQSLYVERSGTLVREPSPFERRQDLMDFLERILVPIGRRMDATRPYLDGRLADGSRFHLILPPLAPYGPVLSIRKGSSGPQAPLSSFGEAPLLEWLVSEFRAGKNLLISGGTGSGKTTLLTRLLETIRTEERLLVVEETGEIRLDHPHVVFLEARPSTPEGIGEVTLRTLIRNALRMRPTRLILGECRGSEAWDLLQAMNTGHAGSACTLHANAPLDALRRLETLILVSGVSAPLVAVREWIASAIHIVVQMKRTGAQRRIHEVVSLSGLEGDRYRYRPISVGSALGR